MKIKRLEILNIASIEKAAIDFDAPPLKDSDVFLIAGDIGAGKSTILDAICLALYGTTPRISEGVREKIAANDDELTGTDPRQLMRQNTGEAYVRLSFDGTDGNSYVAEWQVQRGARKKPSSALSADVWTLNNLTTGEVLTGSTGSKGKTIMEAVQKAVGLDFSQFCRTTVLAQGEFTKFLKSNEKEKASIMEKITGTKIYSEIGAKIYKITKDKETTLKIESDKLNGIELLDPEKIEAKNARIKEIDDANAALVKEWERAVEARRDIMEMASCQAEILRLTQEIDVQLKQQFLLGLKGRKSLEEKRQALKGQRQALSDRMDRQKGKADIYEHSQTIIQLLRTIFLTQQQILQKKNGLPEVSYAELETVLKSDEERLKALNLTVMRNQKEALIQTVNEIQNLLTRQESLLGQGKKLEDSERQNKGLWAEVAQHERELPTYLEKLKAGKELLASLEALKNLSAQTVDQWAKQIRATLKEGCVCPVCQQTLRQALPVESELDQAYRETLKRFEDQKVVVDELTDRLNKMNAEIEAKKRQHGQNEAVLTKSREDLQREERCFLADAAKYGVQVMLGAEEKIKQLKQAKDDEIFQLGLRIADAERLENQVNEKQKQLNQLAALAELEKSVGDMGREVDAYLGSDLVWSVDWKSDIVAFGKLLKAEAQQYHDDKEQLKVLESQLNDADKTLQDISDLRLKTVALQPSWAMLEVNEAVALERMESHWNELYGHLNATLQLKGVAEQKKQQAEQRLAVLQMKDSPEALDGKIAAVEQHINTLKEERLTLAKALEEDAALRKDKVVLQQRVNAMDKDVQQWKLLCHYFGSADGSQFQKIAQGYILGNLLHSANSYLRSLHPRYSLEVVPGTLFISLVDAYQGYASRFVSSLSGGESFLVSLALALALADIGQNLAVDTLFIDEGFGSLSGVELNNAINTLRALHRANGRHVGIISHIDAVKGSIPVQIQVTKEGNYSSSVVKVKVES